MSVFRVLRFVAILALGAIIFFGVFARHLRTIPDANYKDRDDAVITLSHARNLVDFGFVGISPSGERVEGFSAPLQFWVFAAAYAATGTEYTTFLRAQTAVGTLALGAVFTGLLLFPATNGAAGWRYLFGMTAVVAAAQILASSRAFLLWHASGMENAYKTVSLAALLWALDAALRAGRIHWATPALGFIAALSRIDAAVPVAILLAGFAALWWRRHRNGNALRLAVLSLLPWLAYMIWRRLYFGDWVPNTAVAQGISVGSRLAAVVHAPADYGRWCLDVGKSLHAFQLAWLFPLAVLLRREAVALDRAALILAGVLGCVVQYALFGPARMDSARTVTDLALYSTAAVPFVLLGRKDFRATTFMAGLLMVGSSVVIVGYIPPDRAEIGWGAQVFEGGALSFETIGRTERLHRPSVANPDLGAVSWHKQVNIIDLGRLGSAVIPRLENPGRYVSEFAAADIIELHDNWSCQYRDLFTTRAFLEGYVAIRAVRSEWIVGHCPDAPGAMTGIWVRRAVLKDSASPERLFMDAFEPTLDVGLVERELSTCLGGGGPRPCGYVGRTLFRFVPELKRDRRFEAVATILARDPRLRVERAYFTSSIDPRWWRQVIADSQPIVVKPERFSFFALVDGSRSSHSTVSIQDQLGLGWRVVPPLDLFDVQPRSGRGSATLTVVAKPAGGEIDRTVDVPVFAGEGTNPAQRLSIRFKAMASAGSGPPIGAVDTPPDAVVVTDHPVAFQGWAVDSFDMREVSVAYADASGRLVTIGEATLAGMRQDIAAGFPNAHDVFNAGWSFVLEPRLLSGVPRPVVLHFLARGSRRQAEIGTRMIIDK